MSHTDRGGADYYRRQLYDVLSDPDRSQAEKRAELLALGCQFLDVENAHIVKIDRDDGRHEIVEAWGSDLATPGTVSDLDETFCRRTIERDDVLSVARVGEDWSDDPAAERWELGSYVGRKVAAGTELYGTVCLVDADARDRPFTEVERSFVDLLAGAVGRLVERADHEALRREYDDLSELLVQEVDDYAIFRLDPAGFVASWNSGAASLKGYDEDDILGEHFSRFYPESARDDGKPGRLLERARRDGRVEAEGWRVREDGSQFWGLVTITALYDDDGELRGFGKVTRDLTERRSLREQLAAEKRFTERTIDTLEDVYFVLDRDGTIELANERLECVTGSTGPELVGTVPAALFVDADAERIQDAVETAFEAGRATVEATLRAAGGERRRYEVRYRSFETDDDERKVVGIGRDITERTRDEERLEVAQRVLRHNLRNELNVIRGWAETIRDDDGAEAREAVAAIERTADEILDLSEKTRAMAELDPSPEPGERAPLTPTVRGVVDEVAAEHPAATFDVDPYPAEELAVANPELLETALRNAVENAVEHNPDSDPHVEVSASQAGGTVVLAVSDGCPSIPPEERRVLECGESPLSHGSSLGLWLIQWAASALGGTVTFEAADDGNTVRIRVPVDDVD